MGRPACALERGRSEGVDRDLVQRARGGDQDAFEAIVRAYQKAVYRIALRMTRRPEEADEITQETFVRAYLHLDRFELGRPLIPWLARIAMNLALNHLSSPARRQEQISDEEGSREGPPTGGGADPLSLLLSAEFARALDRAVEKLPADQKAVFVLKVHQEMRYEEIAEALGISLGTVMSRLFRARARLKRMLKDYL